MLVFLALFLYFLFSESNIVRPFLIERCLHREKSYFLSSKAIMGLSLDKYIPQGLPLYGRY